MIDWSHPAIIGLTIGIPSFILGWLGYRRAIKVDKSVENAALIAAQTGSAGQVIAGLNTLIENLQEDNKGLRNDIKELREEFKGMSLKLTEVIKERDQIRRECDQIRKDYNVLAKKYGITNGQNS